MRSTLNKVDQEEKKQRSGYSGWTTQQYWERLCTEVRLVQKRWARLRAARAEEARKAEAVRRHREAAVQAKTAEKAAVKPAAVPAAKARKSANMAVQHTPPQTVAVRSEQQAGQPLKSRIARTRRRWNQITRELRAHRFPESNRRPIQFVLMLGGLVPMVVSRTAELLRGRHRRSAKRSGAVRAWLDRRRAHPVVFFGVVGIIAVSAVFFTRYTWGTAVSYDGHEIGRVSSKTTVNTACRKLEGITREVLGSGYTISDDLLEYSTALMPRRDLVDADKLQAELAKNIGLVTYGYSLYVDGELLGATPYEGALEELMQQLKDGISDENTISADFQQEIEVRRGYISTDKIMNLGYLAETLYSTKMEEVTYTIKSGDTWSQIAEKHGMTSKELQALNPGFNINRINIGDVLTLSAAVPYLTLTVTEREHYVADIPFDVEYTDSANLYKGDEKVLSAGTAGSADMVANVTYVNGEETERTVLSVVTLKEPVTEQRARGTKERPTWLPTGSFRWPCSGTVTSRFGYRNLKYSYASKNHKGIDIANKKGTPIYAADGGTVVYAGWMSGYGYLVQIDHGNGYVTYYGHNSSLTCSVGQHVYKGQQIARMGSTGNSTGNHCHFEVRYNGVAKNPLNYL